MPIVIGSGITIEGGITITSESGLDGDLMILSGAIDLEILEGTVEDLEA